MIDYQLFQDETSFKQTHRKIKYLKRQIKQKVIRSLLHNNYKQSILLIFIILCQLFTLTTPITVGPAPIPPTPTPSVFYQPPFMQAGVKEFQLSFDIDPTQSYEASYLINFQRIGQIPGNTYQMSIGFNQLDYFHSTQSQGPLLLQISPLNKTTTSLIITLKISIQSLYLFSSVNYILVNDNLLNNLNFLYFYKSQTNFCNGLAPSNTCTSFQPFTVPATNWKAVTSAQRFNYYRTDDVSLYLQLKWAPTIINATTIKIDVILDHVYLIDYKISILFYEPSLLVVGVKSLVIIQFADSLATNNAVFISFNFTAFTVTPTSYFVGLRRITTQLSQTQFKYYVKFNTANGLLQQRLYILGTDIFFNALAFYGYACPLPFYFNQTLLTCDYCAIPNCVQCSMYPTFYCFQCEINYTPINSSTACTCMLDLVAGICGDFTSSPILTGCLLPIVVNGSIQCLFCDIAKHKILQNNICTCEIGYQDLDLDGICLEECGDGLVFLAQCDDGNLLSNDGCSSTCLIEAGFTCQIVDNGTSTECKSQIALRYSIGSIIKDAESQSAQLQLKLLNTQTLPFEILAKHFKPQTQLFTLKIIKSLNPTVQKSLSFYEITRIDSQNSIYLKFEYDQTIESMDASINIDYSNSKYMNYTQELKFKMTGSNLPLIFSSNIASYKSIGTSLEVGSILSIVCLVVGLLTPKYIGLQAIITLQLIFYSQLLIVNPEHWPVGFLYLKYLKIVTGFNQFVIITSYLPVTDMSQKFYNLQISKLIVQNFALNFLVLLLVSLGFSIFVTLRQFNERKLKKYMKQEKIEAVILQIYDKQFKVLEKNFLFSNFLNQKVFWIANHLTMWCILPILSCISAEYLIQNSILTINSGSSLYFLKNFRGLITFVTLFFIFAIGLNNFRNLWLSHQSMKSLKQKPEEMLYRKCLFVYLLVIGSIIMFFNGSITSGIPFSIVVLMIHLTYTIILLIIHPYKLSLRVHSISIIFYQVVYLIFLIVINLINFVTDLNESIILMLGYFITFSCAVLLIVSTIRFYYEYRYGQKLQKQIQRQRQLQQKKQKQQQQRLLKFKRDKFQQQMKNKLSQRQKIRDRNNFLIQTQIKDQQKKDLLLWLQKKNWQVQQKQKYFFSKFQSKPLQWLQQYDPQQYYKQAQKIKEEQTKRKLKEQLNYKSNQFSGVKNRMKSENAKNVVNLYKKLQSHERRLKTDPKYAMNIMKSEKYKFMQQSYIITQ